MFRKRTTLFRIALSLLVSQTACDPFGWIDTTKDSHPERCDIVWLLRNDSGRALSFEFADFGLHLLPAGQSTEIMCTAVRGSDVEKSFYAVFDYRPLSHPLSVYIDADSAPAKVWTLRERNEPGKQFYNRDSWTFDRAGAETAVWTFTVTAADLE